MSNEYAGKQLLLVGTGGEKRRRVVETLRALGLARVVCLNDARNWLSPWVDDWILADAVRPSNETLTKVDRYVAAHGGARFDGVMTYDDYSVVVAASLAAHLGTPGLAPGVVETVKDKAVFRSACRKLGFLTPASSRIEIGASAELTVAHYRGTFPAVVKPVEGGGSMFVRRVDDARELSDAANAYENAIAGSDVARFWRDRSLVVEEYLDGDEVDIDMLVQAGQIRHLAITDNFAPEEPYFLEVGGRIPSRLPEVGQRALADMAHALVAGLGVDHTCVHLEAKLTSRGPAPIECNLRLGGAEVYAFNREAWDVDLAEGAVRIALGLPVPHRTTTTPRAHLRSKALNPPYAGVIREIRVDDDVRRSAALAELVLFRHAGERIEVPPRGFDYAGWIVARGADDDEAARELDVLSRGVRLVIDPDPSSA